MSKKTSTAVSKKRAQRKLNSKSKKKVSNRSPKKVAISNMDFQALLAQAVKDVKKNNGGGEDKEIKTPEDMLVSIKEACKEAFKLYCYVTLSAELVEKGIIDHKFNIDLDKTSKNFIELDKRITRLDQLMSAPDEEVAQSVEALEIGSLIQQYAEELYNEITTLEPHSLVIEEAIETLAKETGNDVPETRSAVLEQIAYKYLLKVNNEEVEVEEVSEAVFEDLGFKSNQTPMKETTE